MARAESGSITQLGKNRWRVRVSGGNDPITGKRIRLSKVVHGTKKDAIAERTRMQIEVGDIDRATKDMTVKQYMEEVFAPWEKSRVRPTTYETFRCRMNKHIIPHIGGIQMNKLSAYTVDTWIEGLPTPGLRFEVFRTFKQAYTQAYRWGIVHKNIFDKMEKLVADAELAGLIIEAMRGERVEPVFLLEISCGMRLSEALAIDWEDIDFRIGKVSITKNLQHVPGQGLQFFEPKTERSRRTVTIPKGVLSRLLEIRCADGVMRFGALCMGNDGERINPYAYRRYYKIAYTRKLPSQPYIPPKNLRHTHATILLESKTDIKTIADRLGHANIGITATNYLQSVQKLDEDASDAFESAICVARPRKEPDNVVEMRPAREA